MSATRHSLEKWLLPEDTGNVQAVQGAKSHNAMLREIIACLPIPGNGLVIGAKTPGGTVWQATARGSGGGVSEDADFPFKIMADGYTTPAETAKPKYKVLAGTIIKTQSSGGEGDYVSVAELDDTLDGAAHSEFKIWLDLTSGLLVAGDDWPTPASEDQIPNRFRYWKIGTFDASAETGSGDDFEPSVISNIVQIWHGDIPPVFMPEHDHSRTGKGGNKIYLTDDESDGSGAAPKFQVGNSNETNDYLFDYDDGTPKRGLKAKYKG